VTLQYFIDQHTEITRHTVPVGFPVEETEILILDSAGAPTAVVGEIAVCSPYVALGYWRQPELTRSRFLPAPEGGDKRIYRTGDIGRFRPDGILEFVGRTDYQVKIRGFRIELGDIETVLAAHPDVRQVVVVARAQASGDKYLAAYLVPRASSMPTTSELRAFVRQHLPEYMVPAACVILEALPLTPTGKIDRRALPEPENVRADTPDALVTRRDVLDLQLTQIWEKVLGITPIGLQDNFFELGGHSLLAVQLFDYIARLCGKKLPLATLFQAPTIAQLAHVLRQDDWVAPWSSLVAIQPGGSKPPLFCVHAHGGDVLFYRDLATYLGTDQPFYALQAQGLDGTRPPHTSIPEMARHYVQEIRTLQLAGPYFLGGFCLGARIAFEMAQQLQAQGQDVALLAVLDAYAPGFRSTLPQRFAQPYEVLLRLQRLWHHLWNLTLLDAHKRHAYIAMRARGVQKQVRQRLRRSLRQVPFLSALPERSADLQSARLFPRALRQSYVPQVFAGRITVFRPTWLPLGSADDPTMGWGDLAADGVDLYEVPGYHNALVFEPRVRGLAKLLRSCLAETQAAMQVETQGHDKHI
jgi:thioesterase domain-containing protein